MQFLELPTELILAVADQLESEGFIASPAFPEHAVIFTTFSVYARTLETFNSTLLILNARNGGE